MRNGVLLNTSGEYYRGSQPAPGTIDTQGMGDGAITPQGLAAMQGKGAAKEIISKEREEQLASLMNDVKTFIRKIDVKSL
ncbi:MAG: hypothetical protein LLF99_06405 [Desulfobacteraceae bacterium]|nr:hypothetical protein [Desulfobacteraceae bacterium]